MTSVLGSTATNWYVANWSGEGMIAENPRNPSKLVAGGLYQYPSAMNNTTGYYSNGVSGAFTSWDGGRTWQDRTLPSNPAWFNTSSPDCNQLHLADSALAFGPNNTVYYIDLTDLIGNVVGCSVPQASLALYATVSHDGGRTWNIPVAIRGAAGTFVDKPWVAVDPATGEVYVAYTDDGNGSGIFLQNSTDSGANWSVPKPLTISGASGLGVELAVDVSGGVDAAWIDTGTGNIMFTRSSDHGAHFSTPTRIATALSVYTSASPDTFRAYTLPAIGTDLYRTNAYAGALFEVWQNGSGGSPGSPAISLSRSMDDGATWSAPIRVNSNPTPQDYQPSIAIGPDGTVYVDWYAENPTGATAPGHYRLAAALSHDGGRSFDAQFNVSDQDSSPSTIGTGSDWWIGDYTHTIADAIGARPLWTDARSTLGWTCTSGGCLWGYVYNISFYTALLVNDSVGASISVNASLNGSVPNAGAVTLGPTPTPGDWRVGDTYALHVPSSVNQSGTPWSFSYWYDVRPNGSVLFDNATWLNGTVAGGEHPVACFAPLVGGTCRAPGAPGFLRLHVLPSNASITINSLPPRPENTPYGAAFAPGTLQVNATAPQYYDLNTTATVSSGNITDLYLNLTSVTGVLQVRVVPATASLLVDGVLQTLSLGGLLSDRLLPGTHTVSATAPLYYPFTATGELLRPGQTTYLNITLQGLPGWINGTLLPASADLVANGVPVAVAPTGAFSVVVAPGTYWLNATRPGWSPVSSGPLVISPFGRLSTNLTLTEYTGTIVGSLAPANATVTIGGASVTATQGAFRIDRVPGSYWVNVSAWSYAPISVPARVTTNNTTVLYLSLNLSNGWVVGRLDPASATFAVDGQTVAVAAEGTFNVSVRPGTHRLTGSAPGFSDFSQSVTVAPGRALTLQVALAPTGAGAAGSGLGAVGVPILIATAAIAVGVIALVAWRRRRRGVPTEDATDVRPGPEKG